VNQVLSWWRFKSQDSGHPPTQALLCKGPFNSFRMAWRCPPTNEFL
jgi:hypothetical protein